ncbi:serine/threonine-protein kinase [Pyxidicoccus trucidator]|uniref:serine/threonine-protein kinase n=1 Tax=Pyxidicoccus trucidator TaxID=2709662 RepID=UPI001F07F1D8|nr:serine/threonine-protein kinase [Pyxidicoccus trucidator]
MDSLLSAQVGEFVVQERIGSGGMGVVYRAVHPLIGKQVAIKVLRAELVSQQQVERLLIEGRAVNAIHHPGIIDIFGFGSLSDGRPYIIMELLRGHSLSALIRQHGRLDVTTTVRILDEMLAALGAAHRAGVVHRDLKPGNVFMAERADGTHSVKLVDFGIAKLVQSQEGPTTLEGTILGTPEFMAPEQIRGAPSSPAADLYAVGVIAFQMLTGERPFKGEPFQVLFAHVEQTPPAPSSRSADIPPELDTLVLHLLAKDPALRPPSAEAVRQALQRVPRMTPSQRAVPGPSASAASGSEGETWTMQAELPLRPSNASRGPKWAAGALLLAALGGSAYLFWPETPTEGPPQDLTAAARLEPRAEVTPVGPPPTPEESAPEAAPPLVESKKEVPSSEGAPPSAQVRHDEPVEQPAEGAPPTAKPASHGAPPSQTPVSEAQPKSGPLVQPPLETSGKTPEPTKTPLQGPTKDAVQKPKAPAKSRQLPTREQQLQQLAHLTEVFQNLEQGIQSKLGVRSELNRLNKFAPTVSSSDDRTLLQNDLDGLQEKLNPFINAKPSTTSPGVDEKLEREKLERERLERERLERERLEREGLEREKLFKPFQLEQLKQLDIDAQKLRAKAGSSPVDAKAMEELKALRERAEKMKTPEERTSVKSARKAWELKYLGAVQDPAN